MKSDLAKIKFYFPSLSRKAKAPGQFASLIMETMRKDGTLRCAGYLKEKDFRDDLVGHLGSNGIVAYKPISAKKREAMEGDIRKTLRVCHKILPHPDLPIFVFVYPWFSGAKDRILFGGVTAFASYYTMHVFVDADTCTRQLLRETIAHEWNHLVFYRYHGDYQQRALRSHMALEGLAEVFREEAVGGKPAPWSVALSGEEAKGEFLKLAGKLNAKEMKLYGEVFFGSKKYKKWTGYSIGYRFVKDFRKKHPKLPWSEMVKTEPGAMFARVKRKKV